MYNFKANSKKLSLGAHASACTWKQINLGGRFHKL
jgi:hypothetical protein